MGHKFLQLNLVLAVWLAAVCVAADPAPTADVYAKVTRVDQAKQELEVSFAVAPKETHIVFAGDPRGFSAGDYVKLRFDGTKCRVGDAELHSLRVKWKF
jgi:hypothetical protein